VFFKIPRVGFCLAVCASSCLKSCRPERKHRNIDRVTMARRLLPHLYFAFVHEKQRKKNNQKG
jgi:hypothetical protein